MPSRSATGKTKLANMPAFWKTLMVVIPLVFVIDACSSGGGSKNTSEAFCAKLAQTAPALQGDISDATQLQSVVAGYKSLAAIAPDGIKDDLTVMVDLYDFLAKVDMTSSDQRNQALATAMSTKVKQASQNLETYASDTCQVPLTPQTSAAPNTAPVTTG
jgi:hypothetical protein